MTEPSGSRAGARAWTIVAVVLAVVAVVSLVVFVTGQDSAPQPGVTSAVSGTSGAPPSASSGSVPAPSTAPVPPTPKAAAAAPAVPVAAPVSVSLPSLGVTSDLLRLGLQEDGTVEVPPLERDDKAGWYARGPAPGALGPAVILGHIDSARWGPGVFFELGALQPGDEVDVAREDGSVAVFQVDRVAQYPKDDFPTLDVYGNTADAQLRLITCGGKFDSSARSYEDNIVAYATLADIRPA